MVVVRLGCDHGVPSALPPAVLGWVGGSMVMLDLLERCCPRWGSPKTAGIQVRRMDIDALGRRAGSRVLLERPLRFYVRALYLSDLTDVVQGSGSEVTPAGGRRTRRETRVWSKLQF
jgi:hypothetical protein